MIYGYTRVSTEEQGESGLGLDAQRRQILQAATGRGWAKVLFESDVASGKDLNRPAITKILTSIEEGDVLMVAKLDRLSRSVADFAELLEVAKDGKWSVVALDLGVDTSTPTGELIANVMLAVSQWERKIIGQRTKEALHERRLAGQTLGRPTEVSAEAVERIRQMSDAGYGPNLIARKLNEEKQPAPRGETWYPSTVLRIMDREGMLDTVEPLA